MDRNMKKGAKNERTQNVALRKESVDRNSGLGACIVARPGRSPQGERG